MRLSRYSATHLRSEDLHILGIPWYQHRLGGDRIESSPAKKSLGILVQ